MKITDKHGQQWQLVPLDPTESIERAYYWQQEKSGFLNCYPVYKAMLSAAPEPDLPEGLEPVAWLTRDSQDGLWHASAFNKDATDRPLVLQSAALAELAKKDAEIAKLKDELEIERMRLAACSVVAMSNTPESAARNREMLPEYNSASCQDVMRIVDSEMALREQVQRQAALIEQMQDILTDWLTFSADVVPGCAAGADWLDSLRYKTKAVIEKEQKP